LRTDKKTTSIHFYQSPILHETRILKLARTLISLKISDEVIICGIAQGNTLRNEYEGNISITRIKVPDFFFRNAISEFIRLLVYSYKSYTHFSCHSLTYVTVHSLWALPLGRLLQKKKNCVLVYDAQELETEKAGFNQAKRVIARIIERIYIYKSDAIITTSSSFCQWYKAKYQFDNVHLLRNIPDEEQKQVVKSRILRNKFSIPEDSILFIYHGLFSEGRGIDLLLNCFGQTNQRHSIVFMGYGPLSSLIESASKKSLNIHYHAAVPLPHLQEYLSGADVGIFPLGNVSLSYFFCLPNKLFEWLFAGLPVMVSDFPEMAKVVKETKNGWLIQPNIECLRTIVNSLDYAKIDSMKPDVESIRKKYSWRTDAKCLSAVYQQKKEVS